jgi:urease accessory protein
MLDVAETTPVPAGWQARLELRFENVHGRTRLTHRRHEGPLVVQKPLYPEGDAAGGAGSGGSPCHVCLIHPPGGVASGDELQLDVLLRAGSHALLTTPAAGKYYRRGAAGVARVMQSFAVEDAALEWLPQENIFYPNSAVELRSLVRLASGARFIGWEVGCLGLPACNRSLESGELRLGFELWIDDRPLLLERLAVTGAGLETRWGMAGHAAFGTALFYPASTRELALARAAVEMSRDKVVFACTLVDGVLACRALGHRADHVKQAFVQVWRTLRPLLLGREAVIPRIWAT